MIYSDNYIIYDFGFMVSAPAISLNLAFVFGTMTHSIPTTDFLLGPP